MPASPNPPTQRSATLTLFLLSITAALGGLLFGFDTAVISGTLPFITPYFGLTEATLGWAVASVILGAMAGLLFAGELSDKFGRKRVLIAAGAAFALSAIGTALAEDLTFFVAARLLGGMAVGAASMVSPLYIAEISPPEKRGLLVSLNQLTIVIGIVVAFFSNYLLIDIGPNNWRWMFGVEAIPALLFFTALFFVPESPRWLVRRGAVDEAAAVLQRVRSGTDIAAEIGEIREVLKGEHRGQLRDLLAPALRRVLGLGIGLAILQQIVGINVVMYYAPLIFERAGAATGSQLLQTVAVGVVNLGFTLVAMRLIDRAGRRPLILAGSVGMTVSLTVLATSFLLGHTGSWLVLVSVLTYVASFAASWGPAVWVILSEIFPIKLRGLAMSVATFVLWAANFVVSASFPWLLKNLDGGLTFLVYAGICLASLVFTYRYLPETRGKSLEELEKELVGVSF